MRVIEKEVGHDWIVFRKTTKFFDEIKIRQFQWKISDMSSLSFYYLPLFLYIFPPVCV